MIKVTKDAKSRLWAEIAIDGRARKELEGGKFFKGRAKLLDVDEVQNKIQFEWLESGKIYEKTATQ